MIKDAALTEQELSTIYTDGDTTPFETEGIVEVQSSLTEDEVAHMEFLANTLRNQINALLPQHSN